MLLYHPQISRSSGTEKERESEQYRNGQLFSPCFLPNRLGLGHSSGGRASMNRNETGIPITEENEESSLFLHSLDLSMEVGGKMSISE